MGQSPSFIGEETFLCVHLSDRVGLAFLQKESRRPDTSGFSRPVRWPFLTANFGSLSTASSAVPGGTGLQPLKELWALGALGLPPFSFPPVFHKGNSLWS